MDGTVTRLDLRTWSAVPLFTDGPITDADIHWPSETIVYATTHSVIIRPLIGDDTSPSHVIPFATPPRSLALSPDGHSLAVTDGESLKIVDLQSGVISIVAQNDLEESFSTYVVYIPSSWDPGSRYLWIDVALWEGSFNLLLDALSGQLSEPFECYSPPAWFPSGSTFVSTVSASGYLVCGEVDGLFLHTIEDFSIRRYRPFYGDPTQSPRDREFGQPKLSPDTRRIAFAERRHDGTLKTILWATGHAGGGAEVLATLPSPITSLVWAPDAATIYFTSPFPDTYSPDSTLIFRTDAPSTQPVEIASLLGDAQAIDVTPDGKLLLLEGTRGLTLVELPSGATTHLASRRSTTLPIKFLGWQPRTP